MNQIISISNICYKKDFYNYLENYMKNNFIEDNIDWIYKCIQCKQKI